MSAARSVGPLARIGALLAVVLVFVVLGPPIGVFVWSLLIVDVDGLRQAAIDPFDLMLMVPIGYVFGTAAAGAAGLALGIRQAFFGRATWPMAIGAGLLAGAVLLRDVEALDPNLRFRPHGLDGARLQLISILFLTCIIATMLCWALERSWYFARTPAEALP